jgi:hypothetical protein
MREVVYASTRWGWATRLFAYVAFTSVAVAAIQVASWLV